ncbi:MAG: hypothetical protein B6241_11595 [Spirochaetaceae bacterium 4572_59]|nr:MAG: hypothetical protein B6241_11595 [Spirochaetaceae bacterium 4572_59]
MAETLIFHYQKGDSLVHRLDVPVKLAGLFCFSLLLLPVSLFRISLLFPLLLLAHRTSAIHIRSFLKEGLFFLFMAVIIFVSNTLTSGIFMTGALKTVRFILILWMALIFTYTTDPLSVGSGIYRIFKPIPLLPARQISTILGLSLSMLPVILDQYREIREAMWSRCGMNRRSPLRNMIRSGLPLMEGILVKAEDLSDAMESRLFTEDATPAEKAEGTESWTILILLILLIGAILLTERFIPAQLVKNLFFRHF